MLEEGQVWIGPSGDEVTVEKRYAGIGAIFWSTMRLGPVEAGILVTEQGLVEGGYELTS